MISYKNLDSVNHCELILIESKQFYYDKYKIVYNRFKLFEHIEYEGLFNFF